MLTGDGAGFYARRSSAAFVGIDVTGADYRVMKTGERVRRCEPDALPGEAREAISIPYAHLDDLHEGIDNVEARILAWHEGNKASRQLASAPGVGPLTATAIVATVGGGKQFKSARRFAVWLGLTPRFKPLTAVYGREEIATKSRQISSPVLADNRCFRYSPEGNVMASDQL